MRSRLTKVLLVGSLLIVLFGGAFASASGINFASTQFTPIEEQEYMRAEILRAFTAEFGVPVQMVCEDYGPFFNRLMAEAQSGRINTNVIGTLHGDFPALLADGIPAEMPDLATFEGRTFIPEFARLGYMEGKQVYVPWAQATYLMAANKESLQYLPEGADVNALTYAELLEWAKNMYEATGSPKLGFPAGPLGLFGRMIHGYLYPAFTGHQVEKFNSPEALEMWAYLTELFEYAHPSSLIFESMADPLLLEEVWVGWDHTARIGPAVREQPEKFVVFPSPAGPHGRAFITVISGLGIPQGVADVDVALQFIEFMTRPESQVTILEGTGFFPTTLEAAAHVPQGPQRILAEAVTLQAGASDALISLLPIGLGARTGEFVPTYLDTFQAVVVQNRDLQQILNQQERRLLQLFEETGAPYPQP